MEKLNFKKKITQKKPPKYQWQEKALKAISKLIDGNKYRPSIFKCFKNNCKSAEIALSDSMELNRPYSLYFLKVYSALNKK